MIARSTLAAFVPAAGAAAAGPVVAAGAGAGPAAGAPVAAAGLGGSAGLAGRIVGVRGAAGPAGPARAGERDGEGGNVAGVGERDRHVVWPEQRRRGDELGRLRDGGAGKAEDQEAVQRDLCDRRRDAAVGVELDPVRARDRGGGAGE